MGRTRRAFVIVVLTLASCTSRVLPAETPSTQDEPLRLYATTSTLPLVNTLTSTYSLVNPAVTFEVVAGNFESIYERAQADFAGSQGNTYFITNHLPPESIWAAPIGQDSIALIVHPDNPVRDLTTRQLLDIYRGQITNWSEVGGNDREIVVITRENGSGTRAEFERLIIGERGTTRLAQIAPSSAAMVDAVGRDADAIGYVSMSFLDSRVNAVAVDGVLPTPTNVYENTYPLRSILYVAGFREPDLHYRAFIFWIQSPEGQRIISRRHAPLLSP